MKLTITQIRQLPKPKKGFTEFTVGSVMGLKVRIHASGIRSWVFKYKAGGTQNVITLGRVDALSNQHVVVEAQRLRRQVQNGADPAGAARRTKADAQAALAKAKAESDANPTFTHFAQEFITRYAKPRKKTWQRDESQLAKHVLPYLGDIRIQQIVRRDIIQLLDRIHAQQHHVGANRVRALLNTMFNWGIRRDYCETNPVLHTERMKEKPRDRVLTESEIRHLWNCTEQGLNGLVLRFCLLSGKRVGEVLGLKWEHIHEDALHITNTKNGTSDTVPLSSGLRAVLAGVQELTGKSSGYIFAGKQGKPLTVTGIGAYMRRLYPSSEDCPHTHDLRRTAMTIISSLGFSRIVIKRLLNHTDTSVTGVYDRYSYLPEKRKALGDLWAEVQRIVGLNVIHMAAKGV